MTLRTLWIATQFLTRLPTPAVKEFSARELSHSALWFPLVGAVVGAIVMVLVLAVRELSVPLAAALGVIAWVVLTGALHLDGLADLTDALAASHRDPQRFFEVLKDPHVGTFGAVSIGLVLLLKFAALAELPGMVLLALPLAAAWARFGPLVWSCWLPTLSPGQGERFAWSLSGRTLVFWTVVLLAASALVVPSMCLALLVLAAWGAWLRWRLGGATGDCLGAGVEITECALLVVLAIFSEPGPLLLRLI
ncbi:MAG TPA: adenosylcobinamide-GDP ribazoletransferase [Steroidobacteraceae bacterium]